MNKQILKSLAFVFSIHVLAVINILFYVNDFTTDVTSLVFLIILGILAIPTYFVIKNEPSKKWIYTLTSLTAHVLMAVLVYGFLGNVLIGWEIAIVYWTEIFLSCAFGITLLIDLIVNIKST